MTLLISIEYRTRWGEQLVLRLGKRRIALQYADGGVWACAVERYAPAAQPAEYRYEVEREGVGDIYAHRAYGICALGVLAEEGPVNALLGNLDGAEIRK